MRFTAWRACAVLLPILAGPSLAQTPAAPPGPSPAEIAATLAATCQTEDSPPARAGAIGGGRAAPPAPAPGAPPRPQPLRPIAQSAPISSRDLATGFVELFDGRDLTGWEGPAKYWSVIDGVLTAQSGAEDSRATSYLIWRRGTVKDFDLIFTYRLNLNGDSGVQYRNQEVAIPSDPLRGPAFDIGGRDDGFTGNIFEEQGATFLANHGFFAWEADGKRQTIADVSSSEATRACVKPGDWNTGEIIARDDTVIHIINGHVVGIFIDQNPNRLRAGLLGIQLHTGTVGKVEFKSLKLKVL